MIYSAGLWSLKLLCPCSWGPRPRYEALCDRHLRRIYHAVSFSSCSVASPSTPFTLWEAMSKEACLCLSLKNQVGKDSVTIYPGNRLTVLCVSSRRFYSIEHFSMDGCSMNNSSRASWQHYIIFPLFLLSRHLYNYFAKGTIQN